MKDSGDYVVARRCTLPFLMHLVQTCRRFDVPSTVVLTVWIFGRNIRFVRALTRRFSARLPSLATAWPKLGSLAQTSQRPDTTAPNEGSSTWLSHPSTVVMP